MVNPTRGVLYPARLPQFHRLPPPPAAAELVEWFWIPEWDIEPGRSSRQEIVAYPALNLVVDANTVTLAGATTRASHRDLRGSGWAVGALLRPAAVAALIDDPASLVDGERGLDDVVEGIADLRGAVSAAMASGEGHREKAVAIFADWLEERAAPVEHSAHQANAAMDALWGDGAALTPEEAATRLAVSVRTLQRMTHRHVGLPPAAVIRRRRLQEAAERVRESPETDLASIAAELGYADHAHLTRDFQAVLGIPPRAYRSEATS
ncbi:helix-turn-helix domain-containing protein [Microbacterium sp. 2RAF4]|uniref:AraC family transcriptional regulator n=1 Tax=Microbacterium sp. 2RAF4 TaxID=3232999 RepID=UPI003F9491CE